MAQEKDIALTQKQQLAKKAAFRRDEWSEEQWADYRAKKAAKAARHAANQVAKADANRSRKRKK